MIRSPRPGAFLLALGLLMPGVPGQAGPAPPPLAHNGLGQGTLLLPLPWPAGTPPPTATPRLTTASLTVPDEPKPVTRAVVVVKGSGKTSRPLDFGPLFTDPRLWSHADLNDHLFQIGRKFESPEAYEVRGAVPQGKALYVCVSWYTPAASDTHQLATWVVKVAYEKPAARVTLVRQDVPTIPGDVPLREGDYLPHLKESGGKILFLNGDFVYLYDPATGHWTRRGKTPPSLRPPR